MKFFFVSTSILNIRMASIFKYFFIIFLAVFLFGTTVFFLPAKSRVVHNSSFVNFLLEKTETEEIGMSVSPLTEEVSTEESSPSEIDSFSFAVIGDTQSFKGAEGSFLQSVRQIKSKNTDVVVGIGDLVGSCDDRNECMEKLTNWKNNLNILNSKIYAVQGNHDRTGREKADKAWQDVFNFPLNGPEGFSEMVYSFDFKNSHFVILASDKPEEHLVNSKQLVWLEQDLAKSASKNNFVFVHEPAYPTGSKIGEGLDVNKNNRDKLWQILERRNVTAVFSGHEHIHSRKKIGGTYQFIFGNTETFNHNMPASGMVEYAYTGNHFGLIEVNGSEVIVNVYSPQGQLLNSFKMPS